MTVEELISTVRETLLATTDYDPYAEGYQDAICWVCDLLDQLEPSWHPYPQEVPPKEGWYLVTRKKVKETFFDLYKNYGGKGDIRFARDNDGTEDVIAWAELPKPYKKEEI